jgi:hypothetical protein
LNEILVINRQADELLEEPKAISKRAFGMAFPVHKDPALRTQLAGEVHLLEDRLLEIAKELKRIDPAAHRQWFHSISESFLDLQSAEETGAVSLRLGDLRKWG